VLDGTFTRGFGAISGTVRGSFSYGGVRPPPSARIHGKAQFPSFDGDKMRIDLDVRCERPCRAPTGVVRLTRHVGANAEHLTMIPLCVGTSSVGPPHTNLATLAGPAFDRDGVLVGRMTVGMSDFGDGQRPGIPGLPYIDEALASVTSNGDESPFCPNALRDAGGPEITRGDIKIECDTGGC
jgi:hypothetical protein